MACRRPAATAAPRGRRAGNASQQLELARAYLDMGDDEPRACCCAKCSMAAIRRRAQRPHACCASCDVAARQGVGDALRAGRRIRRQRLPRLAAAQQAGRAGAAQRADRAGRRWKQALSFVADAPVDTVCAGRTDAGVHAACQVVHFDSDAPRDPRGWVLGTTSRLPERSACAGACRWPTISMRASPRARAAIATRILNRAVRPALGRQYLSWERRPLDAEAMHARRAGAARRARFHRVPHRALPGAACAARPAGDHASRRDGDEVVGRGAGQRIPASHGAQHRRFAAGGRARRAARSLDRANCSPGATAPSPARRRRRPAWCSSVRSIPRTGTCRRSDLPVEVTHDAIAPCSAPASSSAA